MESLKQSGRFVLPDAMLAAIREQFDQYDAFLRKPFKIEMLIELVQKFIGR